MVRTGDRALMRELNAGLVVDAIRRQEPISRAAVADVTGLSRATVTAITAVLLDQGWIREVGTGESLRGRRPVLLQLERGARFCLGVKIAPDTVSAAVGDLRADLSVPVTRAVQALDSAEVLAAVQECCARALEAAGVDRAQVIGVGAVLPGVVDPQAGIAVAAPSISWSNVPLRWLMQEKLQLPVFLENDANAFALAECHYGAGRGRRHVLGVTLGVGIGAGIVLDGRIYRGAHSGAGELGHMNVLPGGPQCSCGRRGCLEAVAADAAIAGSAREEVRRGGMRRVLEIAGGEPTGINREAVVDAARAGDGEAVAVLRQSGEHIGRALANVVNLLNPATIVIGGELVQQAGELILGPVREAVYRGSFAVLGNDLEVAPTALGEQSWLKGAVSIVLQEVFRLPVSPHADHSSISLVSGLGGAR